jgi:hypothetical protein
MPFCPNCGKEVAQGAKFCGNCGYTLTADQAVPPRSPPPGPGAPSGPYRPTSVRTDVGSALSKGVNIISSKPIVLVPAIIGAVVSAILSSIAAIFFYPIGFSGLFTAVYIGLFIVGIILSIIGGIIAYIMAFASLDMARDAYVDKPLSLGESVGYIVKRLGTFIVASIVGAILSITVILIPVVILMFVIMVVDEAGISASLSKAVKVIGARLGDIILLLIIDIVGAYILGLIPFIGPILVAAFNVLISLAFIDIYFHYKTTITL